MGAGQEGLKSVLALRDCPEQPGRVRIAYLYPGCGAWGYAARTLRGNDGGLPAVLCAGRVVLFHCGDGTTGGNSG